MINFSITLLGRLHKSVCENRNVATIATHDFSKVTRFNISNYSSLTKKGISPPSQNTEQQIRSMRYLFRKPHFQLSCFPHLVLSAHCSLLMIFIFQCTGSRTAWVHSARSCWHFHHTPLLNIASPGSLTPSSLFTACTMVCNCNCGTLLKLSTFCFNGRQQRTQNFFLFCDQAKNGFPSLELRDYFPIEMCP